MQHCLSVTGMLTEKNIPKLRGVEAHKESGGVTFTAYSAEDMQRLKRSLSLLLADMITEKYEANYLSEKIASSYTHLTAEEQKYIQKEAEEALEHTEPNRRACYIENKLYDFLTDSNVLSVDGFVRFRLQEYRAVLGKAVETAADTYFAEKEYAEFIMLLRYYVDIQPCMEETVHVLPVGRGYMLLNGKRQNITARYMEETNTWREQALTADDVLLSTLISLAPQMIVLHTAAFSPGAGLLETLWQIFPKRIQICDGCRICQRKE